MNDETNKLLVQILALTMLAEQLNGLTRDINRRVDDHDARITRLEKRRG
jgi:hypothetical protein